MRFSERGPRLRVERARARPEVHNLNTHAAMTHASIMHACVAVAGSNHYSFHLRAQRSIFAVRVGDVAFSRALIGNAVRGQKEGRAGRCRHARGHTRGPR